MARRSDYTRDELKQMAINAGQEIIIKEGFANFSARGVARSIGYSIGTIYNIFDSHDDLILNINAVTLDDMANFLDKKVSKTDDKAIKQLAAAYIEFAKNNYNRWSALFEHNLSKEQQLPNWYQNKVRKLFSIAEKYFVGIVKNKKSVQIVAKTIWASIHGICQLSLTGKLDTVGVKSIELLTNSLIDNYLKGIKS